MRRAIALSLLLTLAGTSGAPAIGQTTGLRGHNSNAPVDWEADRVEVQERADRVVLSGNVVARQARLTLSASRITVAYTDTRGIDINRLTASGGVTVKTPTESARGEFGIYDLDKKIITLIGGVTLTQRDARVSGGRLTIDLETGRAVMDGGASAQGGRVTGSFTVKQGNP